MGAIACLNNERRADARSGLKPQLTGAFMFVVFGATGNTGKVVAQALLERGQKVRLAVRDVSKVKELVARGAEAMPTDVLDAESVSAALKGADGAYLLVPPDPTATDFVARGKAIVAGYVAAVNASGVKHVVFLSSVAAQVPVGTGPIVTAHNAEVAFREHGKTAFTFLRAAYFMENILANVGPMKGDGVLPVFGGGEGHPFPMVATKDIGAVAASLLLEGAPKERVRIVELQGPKDYSYADAAQIAADVLKRKVTATAVPLDAMAPTLMGFGFSQNVAGLYREMTEAFGKGVARFEGTGMAVRGTVTLSEVLSPALR